MASKLFRDAVTKARASKNLDTFVVGNAAQYLREGTHDVTVQAVDVSEAEQGRITVTFTGEGDKAHNEKLFLVSQQGDINFTVRSILAACLPSIEALDKFFAELIDNDNINIFGALAGMKLRVTMGYGKGVQIRATSSGKYAAYDTTTNMPMTDEVDTHDAVKAEIEVKGLKRAFLKVKNAEATNGPTNIKSLEFALAALARKRSGGGGTVTQFVANV
jgi:hypothetical protein